MKRLLATTALAVVLAAPSAMAQEQKTGDANQQQQQQTQAAKEPKQKGEKQAAGRSDQAGHPGMAARLTVAAASSLIGSTLIDANGAPIGEVDYMLVRMEDGDVSHLLVGPRGIGDNGERLLVVPWHAVEALPNRPDRMMLQMPAAALNQAPVIDREDLAQLTSPAVVQRVQNFYAPVSQVREMMQREQQAQQGEQGAAAEPVVPMGQAIQPGRQQAATGDKPAGDQAAAEGGDAPRTGGQLAIGTTISPGGDIAQQKDQTGGSAETGQTGQQQAQADGAQGLDDRHRQEAMQPQVVVPSDAAKIEGQQQSQAGGETGERKQQADDAHRQQATEPHVLIGRQIVTAVAAPDFQIAESLTGSAVIGRDGKRIGEIDQVMIDTAHGRIAYVLLARGGYLGVGEEWLPVPFEKLEWRPGQAVVLNAEPRQLEKARSMPKSEAPTRISAAHLNDLYQQYGVQPYWQEMATIPGETAGEVTR